MAYVTPQLIDIDAFEAGISTTEMLAHYRQMIDRRAAEQTRLEAVRAVWDTRWQAKCKAADKAHGFLRRLWSSPSHATVVSCGPQIGPRPDTKPDDDRFPVPPPYVAPFIEMLDRRARAAAARAQNGGPR